MLDVHFTTSYALLCIYYGPCICLYMPRVFAYCYIVEDVYCFLVLYYYFCVNVVCVLFLFYSIISYHPRDHYRTL